VFSPKHCRSTAVHDGLERSGSVAADWTTDESRSSSPSGVKNFNFSIVQTGSGVNPTSYPTDVEGSFPGDQAAGG
jgi:hypothetical protein